MCDEIEYEMIREYLIKMKQKEEQKSTKVGELLDIVFSKFEEELDQFDSHPVQSDWMHLLHRILLLTR